MFTITAFSCSDVNIVDDSDNDIELDSDVDLDDTRIRAGSSTNLTIVVVAAIECHCNSSCHRGLVRCVAALAVSIATTIAVGIVDIAALTVAIVIATVAPICFCLRECLRSLRATALFGIYALRVFPAETWLTVYRRLRVWG